MPKDWDNHKAEIERLYMVEHLPLKDVRDILRTQHAFDASTRSYRMKLDEWRMWKNHSKNERRRTKTMSRHRQPRAITVSESVEEVSPARAQISALPPPVYISGSTQSDFIYGISLPFGSLDITELLPLISILCTKPECGLELMLFKWKSDGSYFVAAMKFLWENEAAFRIKFPTLLGGSIFRCIDDSVASHEKYPLTKRCLTIDFEQAPHESREDRDSIPDWMRMWREACASQSWKDVKECLKRIYLCDVGSFFVPSALGILAEKLLQKNMQKLEQWRGQVDFISMSGADQVKLCRQEFMDILGSFKEDVFDLHAIWYKRFFQLHEPDDTKHWPYKILQLDQLREYRQKFSELKILHDSASSTDGMVPNLLNAATVLKESKVILDTIQCEDVPLPNEDLSPHPSTPIMVQSSQRPYDELRTRLKDTYKNWVIGHDNRKYVYHLLRHLKSLSISTLVSPEQNVFILIEETIPQINQLPFTLHVLKVITDSCCQLPTRWSEDGWEIWSAVRDSVTLESLKEILAKKFDLPYEVTLSLDDRMQPVVVKLTLDAFAGLIGEYLLWDLKAHIKRCHASSRPYTLPLYAYKAVLDGLYRRKIKLNQDLFAFLGRLFVWEGTGENGPEDEDDEGRPFFETSDNEPNNSESESLESNTDIED